MFANAFQSGFISVFYSVGSNPLSLWDKSVKNGHIRRVVDDEVKSLVLELSGTNVATTYITCPIKARASLAIKLPFLVMIVKNMKKYFTFEIQVADDKEMRRRFRVSNFQSTTKVRPFCTTMPIGLSPGWNQIQFNLADFTKRAYGTTYLETVRVQIHANVRIRRIYFSDRLYGDDEMPQEFKLFLPVPGTRSRQDQKKGSKEIEKRPSKEAEAKVPVVEEEIPSVAPPATPAESPKLDEPVISQISEEIPTPIEEEPAPVEEPSPEVVEEVPPEQAVEETAPPEEIPPVVGEAEAPAATESEPQDVPVEETPVQEASGEEAPVEQAAAPEAPEEPPSTQEAPGEAAPSEDAVTESEASATAESPEE
ncbi:hypothetical protein PPYR_08097 [Photinus pyralis]|uniref:CFA20 domain-containing protein n=1 Tax=Photinus pyralis TaxID=7054 RepID=A0A5N4AIH9_PHOPY|nr:cilia- and flagella-associated protein 20-like [Photinus pyralis]KAB0797103.1 hypothetical protein PPYR_08097 [Photinus pyralis]